MAASEPAKAPTVQELREAIPQYCFQRNELKFLLSVLQDLLIVSFIFYLGSYIPLRWAWLPVWVVYWAVCGTAMTGIWVLGHECGHEAFSSRKSLNHVLGYVLHTALLVPYFSWRWSHYVHHSKNNHIDEGETHVPGKFGEHPEYLATMKFFGKYHPIYRALMILGPGWLAYLILGATGGPARGKTNHFIVPNALFPPSKVAEVHFSTLGLIVMLGILYKLGSIYGFWPVFMLYFPSWTITNSWLTLITFLQHTEKEIKWYDSRKWEWLIGSLGTIDRNYPWVIDQMHHHIGTTHVLHHVFSTIPHYHAQEATEAIKKKLGGLYNSDPIPFYKSFYESCKLVYVND